MVLKDILNYIFNKSIYNKILDNIWIGNKQVVKNMEIYKNIDVIINCSKNIPFYNTSKINHRISITNNNSIENIKNLETYLEMSADLIKYHTDQKKKILIHCDTSRDLSPSILVAYLIKYKNINLYESCDFIMNKHSLAFIINAKFKLSLINYEYNILKKNHKNISYIHFKKFKLFWITLIAIILIIIIIASSNNKSSNNKSSNNKSSNNKSSENEFLNVVPKKLIYDFKN
jgi:protein-tyrosine phosphatase